jgi:hypothetical protein
MFQSSSFLCFILDVVHFVTWICFNIKLCCVSNFVSYWVPQQFLECFIFQFFHVWQCFNIMPGCKVKTIIWFNLSPWGYVLYWYVLCTSVLVYYFQAVTWVGLMWCVGNDLYKLNHVIDVFTKSKTQPNNLL